MCFSYDTRDWYDGERACASLSVCRFVDMMNDQAAASVCLPGIKATILHRGDAGNSKHLSTIATMIVARQPATTALLSLRGR